MNIEIIETKNGIDEMICIDENIILVAEYVYFEEAEKKAAKYYAEENEIGHEILSRKLHLVIDGNESIAIHPNIENLEIETAENTPAYHQFIISTSKKRPYSYYDRFGGE